MTILLAIFGAAVLGMAVIPLRHISRVRVIDQHVLEAQGARNSIARVYIVHGIDRIVRWFRWHAREEILKILDRILKMLERLAGRLAGEMKNTRLLVQERFRVIPRESLYWKQIHSWKKTHGGKVRKDSLSPEGEQDISYHF